VTRIERKTRRAVRKVGHGVSRALDQSGGVAVRLERDVEKGARGLKHKAKRASRRA
jgi:hypothetical protein